MSTDRIGFVELVARVEARLAQYYDFLPQALVANHLVTESELVRSFGDSIRKTPEFKARAAVYFSQTQGDDLFIGLLVEPKIIEKLERFNPEVNLDDRNLDEFCILVEEVSHFHLLLNRASSQRGVSKLELEWQGEIDKLLITSILLKEQYGDKHVEPLARKLYDTAKIIAEDFELYWQATKFASHFWRSSHMIGPEADARIRETLLRNYWSPWQDKVFDLRDQRKAS